MNKAELIDAVSGSIAGRLVVFFPGQYEHNSYRLLDARDGWDYLATPITAEGAPSSTRTLSPSAINPRM
jgi:hypothetical protein